MNLVDKFKSIFSFHKEEPKLQTTEDVIEELVNRLIFKLKADGKSIASPTIAEGFGSLTIYAHDVGTEGAFLKVQSDDWEIKVKPYFKKL